MAQVPQEVQEQLNQYIQSRAAKLLANMYTYQAALVEVVRQLEDKASQMFDANELTLGAPDPAASIFLTEEDARRHLISFRPLPDAPDGPTIIELHADGTFSIIPKNGVGVIVRQAPMPAGVPDAQR